MTTTNKDLFAKHVALGTFVETGTCQGRSVAIALDIGFKEVRSVEGSSARFLECRERFKDDPRVTLYHGESAYMLPVILHGLVKPVLFWLDSHPSGEGSYGQDYETVPEHGQSAILRAELAIIKARGVRGDVVLIDDLTPDVELFAKQLFMSGWFTIHSTDEGKDKVLEIML